MTLDPELLAILVCPKCRGALERVDLPEPLRRTLVDRYREHFRDQTPVVEHGLLCRESQLVFPIVSDIPVMLEDEALPASALAR
ncbi:MAG: Trm112 family protein [Thermoanaerobaculia bacterium]